MINDKIDPVIVLLKRYKEMSKDGIIGHLADWFNVIGQDEFDKAVKKGLIIPVKERRGQWKIAGDSKKK